ncbi:MAG: hypothetical protein JXO22_16925 [Phycisphaerae bacterium]|nr:hypothetical protein [Phycisphaerae bacterium]
MFFVRYLTCLLVIGALILGGCPTTSTSSGFDSQTPSGSTSDSTGDTTSTPGGVASGSQSSSSGSATSTATCIEPVQADAWRQDILDLVNAERISRGLSRLKRNATLEAQADAYACEMISYGFFDHVNPVTGSTLDVRAEEFGYDFQFIGENLAAGQETPEAAMEDWMDSPGHRANILEPDFEELGVGIRVGGTYGYYWVQEFGQPR